MLNSKQIAFLKAKSHSIVPVVSLGHKGMSDSVINEIDVNLSAHELIKIKIQNNSKEGRNKALDLVCQKLNAQPINHIGKILVIFRANKKTKIDLP